MSFPKPYPGLVIRYAYLWREEHLRGQEEGGKDRPCAILLTVQNDVGEQSVTVLPVTHSPPSNQDHAVEIPAATKRRLGLDDQRSWVMLTESNRFIWPGPDLRPFISSDPQSVVYGLLPAALYDQIRKKWLALYQAKKAKITKRSS